jgi:hypothetical protein
MVQTTRVPATKTVTVGNIDISPEESYGPGRAKKAPILRDRRSCRGALRGGGARLELGRLEHPGFDGCNRGARLVNGAPRLPIPPRGSVVSSALKEAAHDRQRSVIASTSCRVLRLDRKWLTYGQTT